MSTVTDSIKLGLSPDAERRPRVNVSAVGGNGTEGTFSNEKRLPKLPLPDLRVSLEALNESLQPLYYADGYYKHPLEPEQLRGLSNDISIFLESEAAKKLQGKLEEFSLVNDCYLDNLHLDVNNSYTNAVQDEVLPRNPFLVLAEDAVPDITQTDRSAVLVHSALRFIAALRNGVLPVDRNAKTGEPLSMFPYLNLFGTTRCPVFVEGEIENFDLEKPYTDSDLEAGWSSSSSSECEDDGDQDVEGTKSKSFMSNEQISNKNDIFTKHGISSKRYPGSKHLLVISRGQYYTLDVFDDSNNIIHDVSSLVAAFNFILHDSMKPCTFKKSTALGSLTSHSFKNWKYARKRLQKRYPDELMLIDSSLFVLVLDESTDCEKKFTNEIDFTIEKGLNTSSSDCKRLFYGTSIIDDKGHQVGSCISRWYDKLQLVVTADSKAGVIWDSFTCDGSAVLRFISEIYTESVLRLARDVNSGDSRFSLWPSIKDSKIGDTIRNPTELVTRIDWDFSNILNTHVHLSETKLADLISKHDIVHVSIPFGRRAAQRLGVSSDSMIQVALQIAHYALYGRMVYGFEPISTRKFRKSRSCFINIQNQDLLELCQLFISNSFDGNVKLEKFVSACEKHSVKVKKAKENGGFEKHFNALRYLYKFHDHYGIYLNSNDRKISANIFENPLVKPFSAPDLIVANCGNAATTTFGITPAVPQGFGIGYIVKDDQCDLTVTSQFRQADRLMFMLNWVLQEIRNFWKKSNASNFNKTGVKISPLIDKLYEMDNALNSIKKSNEYASQQNKIIKGYGFFDLQGHIDSKNSSRLNSQNNSSLQLSDLANTSQSNLGLNKNNILLHSSPALSVPTEKEKQETGCQIHQIQPENTSDEETSPPSSASKSDTVKRSNVINSKFEIDFDRSGVGRKIQANFD
ncbi:hypothetical protein HG535_0C05880 [Zygotorulaspora mrakii]|uniref:Choline/carnitine acyltransferase domain-containing protein n=1 Tax=Zygotorulaspora mrakii TaxID=42260 RepID=A0A7H9B1G8_ZYGMR|nr:uncharacterized protein HG535_0C05880 [Zygotorulaspora mrakii]QLG72234.1 hypothetical protein HG535_0C05880 [Zygotorulaspora mrakii]